jgi:hypothetical protein
MRSRNTGGPPALPPEAAVTYTRLPDEAESAPDPADDGRVEPHFTTVALERKPRFEEVAVPVDRRYAEDRPIATEMIAGDEPPGRPRRSRAVRFVLLVGALAILGGAGVLAVTAIKVLYGGVPALVELPAAEGPLDMTPAATARTELPDSGSAGPGVLAIPSSDAGVDAAAAPTGKASTPPNSTTATAAPMDVARPQPGTASLDEGAPAPIPRARPAPTTEATLPRSPAPAPTAAAPASGTDADINNALTDIDQLLAKKRADAAAAQTASPPADQAAAGGLSTDAFAAAPPLPIPPPPSRIDPNVPVPPADIPNPRN